MGKMTRKQKLGIKILIVALGAILILSSFIGCVTEEGKGTIVFADRDFDSPRIHNRIAAFILKHGYGYQSEFIPSGTMAMWVGLERGEMDVTMECWVEAQEETYDKYMATGEIVSLGSNFPGGWQGWLVPTYVIEGDPERGIEPMAPDLKSVDDFPKYWELFKDPEDPTKGCFYGSPPGWLAADTIEWQFKACGLDEYYNVFLPGSDAALAASLVAAYDKGEPWFGYYWEPTWVLGKVDFIKFEVAPYDKEIWDAWEPTRACAFPLCRVEILVNVNLLDRAPEVVEFLRSYETTVAMVNNCLFYMQETEADAEAAAIYFLQEYESLWTQWVPADIASKVKAALP